MKCFTEHLALQNSMSNHLISLCSNIFCMLWRISCPVFFFFLVSIRCSYDSILQANHVTAVSTSWVSCLSSDIEKSFFTFICELLSDLFGVGFCFTLSPALLSTSQHLFLYLFYYRLSSVYLHLLHFISALHREEHPFLFTPERRRNPR